MSLTADSPRARYERVAAALVAAHAGDETAMRVVWDFFGHGRSWDALRRYVRLDLGRAEQPRDGEVDEISPPATPWSRCIKKASDPIFIPDRRADVARASPAARPSAPRNRTR
jgi:hypothetical protein